MPAEGHAYAHHLFIEQSMNHTKPGGHGDIHHSRKFV